MLVQARQLVQEAVNLNQRSCSMLDHIRLVRYAASRLAPSPINTSGWGIIRARSSSVRPIANGRASAPYSSSRATVDNELICDRNELTKPVRQSWGTRRINFPLRTLSISGSGVDSIINPNYARAERGEEGVVTSSNGAEDETNRSPDRRCATDRKQGKGKGKGNRNS